MATRVRKNIRKLDRRELRLLRLGFECLYDLSKASEHDTRGYQWIAGRHGYPGNYCHNDARMFWTWHRAYVYEFEMRFLDALTIAGHDFPDDFGLPYWDWTYTDPATDDALGIPTAISDTTYEIGDTTKANPLASAFSIATQTQTKRSPSAFLARIPWLKRNVQQTLTLSDFSTASSHNDNGAHGAVHVLVGGGGDMHSVRTAAFDPCFWFHHAFVDKIFWEWQRIQGQATITQSQKDYIAQPFRHRGVDLLDSLGYLSYTYSQSHSVRSASSARRDNPEIDAPSLVLELVCSDRHFDSAKLSFLRTQRTKDSFEIRIFLESPDADHKTSTESNPKFADSVFVFGHGACIGGAGHCTYVERRTGDRREPHHFTPHDLVVDITAALKVALNGEPGKTLITLVFLDSSGEPISSEPFKFERAALDTL